MIIVNKNRKFNYEQRLKPLFEAMARGKRIKSVRVFRNSKFSDDPSKDFFVKDFIAIFYWKSFNKVQGNWLDYIETDKSSFVINYVRDFELY
jgi:hypothetical protein